MTDPRVRENAERWQIDYKIGEAMYASFEDGYRKGRADGVKWAVEMLRSKRAGESKEAPFGLSYASGQDWADWLEARMKEKD